MTSAKQHRITWWLASLALSVGACASPSTAPTPTPAPLPLATVVSLTIGGSATLVVSQTSQLTATVTYNNGFTETETYGPTWQSTNTTVATVSPTGLVTGTTSGIAVVTATSGTKAASLNVTVTTTGSILSCGTFTGPGPFVLAADLANMPLSCLTFSNNTNAQLDCRGHDVSSMALSGVKGFSIRNCVMHGSSVMGGGVLRNLSLANSSNVTIDSSNALGQVFVQTCQSCTFSNDVFVYPMVGFTPPGGTFASCELCLDNGQGNTVSLSTIDGGWTGTGQQPVDDGIGFNNDASIVLRGNIIRNVFDAGIEADSSPGPVTATIQTNTISNAGFTGIGGYYVPGWQNSVFSGNTVLNAPNLWWFVHAASASSGVTTMTLVNNQFVGNTFRNPQGTLNAALIDYVSGGLVFTVQGNLVQGNNFGPGPGPVFSPLSGFIDGGGNTCGPGGNLLSCGGGLGPNVLAPRAASPLFHRPPSSTADMHAAASAVRRMTVRGSGS